MKEVLSIEEIKALKRANEEKIIQEKNEFKIKKKSDIEKQINELSSYYYYLMKEKIYNEKKRRRKWKCNIIIIPRLLIQKLL